jgi:hypothetical protein
MPGQAPLLVKMRGGELLARKGREDLAQKFNCGWVFTARCAVLVRRSFRECGTKEEKWRCLVVNNLSIPYGAPNSKPEICVICVICGY